MPRLRAQHEAPRPDPDYPQLGRDEMDHAHAVFSIARSLDQLGLSAWLPTLIQWLGQYDGLETMLEDQYDPAICVRQVMLQHVVQHAMESPRAGDAADASALKRAIVRDLLQLDFVCYCAYFGEPQKPRLIWRPLEPSWLRFREGREGEEQLCGWYSENVQPYLNQLSTFLLSDGPGSAPESA